MGRIGRDDFRALISVSSPYVNGFRHHRDRIDYFALEASVSGLLNLAVNLGERDYACLERALNPYYLLVLGFTVDRTKNERRFFMPFALEPSDALVEFFRQGLYFINGNSTLREPFRRLKGRHSIDGDCFQVVDLDVIVANYFAEVPAAKIVDYVLHGPYVGLKLRSRTDDTGNNVAIFVGRAAEAIAPVVH